MAMSFIEAKSTADDIMIDRRQNMKKMADVIIKYAVSKVNSTKDKGGALNQIDTLLDGFSAEEKYEIMKMVFLKMC